MIDTVRKIDPTAQPPNGTTITHGVGMAHRFMRDAHGAWSCGCGSHGWTWLNVADYVNHRGPIQVSRPEQEVPDAVA